MMPRLVSALIVALSLFAAPALQAQQLPIPPALAAKSWLLLETGSGQELATQNADQRLEPASLTKLMTAYLTFTALRQQTLAVNQTVPVSERAWRTGGSKMFIRVGTQVGVDDLIRGMIVQSGNDACIALAEAIAGSEEQFAVMMNREAQRLGMKASSFRNSTGLPDPQHYTTARDLATLASALIRDFPEEYRRYYSQKEFRYNNITQPNRNRLLWLDPTVDGVKTGHTDAAGYCLISSAQRGPRRLLAVVLGTDSDATRTSESLKLLNWGYQFFDGVPFYRKGQAISSLRVFKGATGTVKAGFAQDLLIAVPKGFGQQVEVALQAQQPLLAPVAAGQRIGTLRVSLAGKPYGEFPVVALEAVPAAGLIGRNIDSIKLWFN